MRRREFIAGLGSAAAWPLAARAQQGTRMRRIGVLLNVAADDRNKLVWADVLNKNNKAKVCWTLDNRRWKEALLSALQVNPL